MAEHRAPLYRCSAEFVVSAALPADLPPSQLPEVCLVGRSNVGKSSLINALVQRKRLAFPSAAPGKTRLANFFRVTVEGEGETVTLHLVDTPGYGYARRGAPERERYDELACALLAASRPTRAGAVLIVDARHPGLEKDVAAKDWLKALGVPLLVAATKADKLSRHRLALALAGHEKSLGERPIPFSAVTGAGRPELWSAVFGLLRSRRA